MKLILTLMTMILSLAANHMHASNRPWEQWNGNNVSQTIDAFWLSSEREIEHRNKLAALTSNWVLPNDRFLEIGCGSGLVYNVLVPDVIPNELYLGVDITDTMLDIARNRFPEGSFAKDDLYDLSFPDNSFDLVVAYEVFGHIGHIKKPIQEMYRTTSRAMIFTVWTGPETKIGHELWENTVFMHTTFTHQDVMNTIESALGNERYEVYTESITEGNTAYIIYKL
jgi:ubiquinone/menaquinone biosynthesis C-methylase UbiE